LFRRLFLEALAAAYRTGQLQCFGEHRPLNEPAAFNAFLTSLRKTEWVVYAKRPFSGPEAVLAYLARYTHRVAIANSRLIAHDERGVTFKWKDYRARKDERYKTMTLATDEFIRRFLLHVLPRGFHRIRHYGALANHQRADALATARELLGAAASSTPEDDSGTQPPTPTFVCPGCGAAMLVIATFERGHAPRASPRNLGPPCSG